MTDLELPTLTDRYAITHRLGAGSQKSVYLATDTLLSRPVAISVFTPSSTTRRLFLKEARAMAQIGDLPNLVAIYDVIESDQTFCLVSQYLPGGTLAAFLSNTGQHVTRVLRFAIQLTRALESLHARDIAHGDLTPRNVLLDADAVAHVSDFGLSNLANDDETTTEHPPAFAGTLTYMAPERAWGSPPSAPADIYALGCILYEAATGAPPHAGCAPDELLRRKSEAAPPPVTKECPTIPEALSDLITATLASDPAARPESARDLRAALEGLSRGSVLVGSLRGARPGASTMPLQRERAHEAVRAAVRSAAAGTPTVLLLTGDAGLGKSRLLQTIAEETQAASGVATLGHTRPEAALAFQPFVDALLPLAARIPELPKIQAGVLRTFLRLGGDHAENAKPNTALDRRGIFIGLFGALRALGQARPLAILLDDLDVADQDSIELFEFLVCAIDAADEPAKILLAAAFRTPAEGSPLEAALDRLQQSPSIALLRLEPFNEASTFGFLRSLGLDRPANRLVRELHQVTRGNPLFLIEAVDSLKRQNALETRNGMTTIAWAQHLDLPASLSSAILDRTKAVTQPCRRLLTIASFIGDSFDLDQLTAVAGTREDALLDLVEEALSHDLLTEEVVGFRFAHPLVRQALYRRSSHARRRRIHNQIAARLEKIHGEDLDRATPEIAHHLMKAGPAADPERTLHYTAAAADQATAAYAWSEASDLYAAAIDAAAKTGRLSKVAQAELHRRSAIVLRCASDSGLALEQYDEAIAAFEDADDRSGLAEALEGRLATQVALGGVAYGKTFDVAPVQKALDELPDSETGLRARLLGTLALASWAAHRPDEALPQAEGALELAKSSHDDRLASDISTQLALSQLQQMQPRAALATFESGLADARKAGDPIREEAALQRVPMVLQLLGEVDRARKAVAEAERLNRVVHNAPNLSLTLANKTTLAALHADADDAARQASECVEVMKQARYGWSGMLALPALACAHALAGHEDEARRAVDQITHPGVVFDDPSFFVESMSRYHHLIAAYAGHPIESNISADLSQFEPGPNGLDFAFITPLCVEVEIAWFGNAATISPVADHALALADRRGMLFSTAWPFLIPRVRGIAATMEERWDDAECSFVRAIEIADEQRIVPEMGRSRLDYATMLLTRDPRGGIPSAADFLKESAVHLHQAGLVGFERRAATLAESAGISL